MYVVGLVPKTTNVLTQDTTKRKIFATKKDPLNMCNEYM